MTADQDFIDQDWIDAVVEVADEMPDLPPTPTTPTPEELLRQLMAIRDRGIVK